MNKALLFAAVIACALSVSVRAVSAAELTDIPTENDQEYIDKVLEEQYRASGADKLDGALSDEVRYRLKRAGINLDGGTEGVAPDVEMILSELSDTLSEASETPVRFCAAVLAVIMIYSLVGGISTGKGNNPSAKALGTGVTAALCCVIAAPAAAHIGKCADGLTELGAFVEVLIPVVSAVMLASGSSRGAVNFSVLTAPVSGILGYAAAETLIDGLRIYLALACVSSVSDILRLDGFLKVIEKNIKWALTFTATVYLGVLAVSCTCAAAADNVGQKAFKLVVSGSVPVIGGAVSDALATLRGCVGMLRSTVGSFALLAAAFIVIPPVIRTVLWRFALEVCAAAAAVFDVKSAEKLLHCCAGAMDILLSLLLFFGVLIVGSLACVIGGGV